MLGPLGLRVLQKLSLRKHPFLLALRRWEPQRRRARRNGCFRRLAKTLSRKPSPRHSPWCLWHCESKPVCGKKKKQKANTGKCFRDYYFIYLILFYSFNAMLNFLQKHLVVCNSRLILGTIAVSESVRLTQ